MRIGIGYDSHTFATGRKLILAGVDIPFEQGLFGHSDADVVAHAVIDALLGAAALGDIGMHFPPSDDRWRDADSLQMLQTAYHLLEEQNYQVVNIDVTVILEKPKLTEHVQAMRENIARAVGIGPQHVSIKGKTNEGMGSIGRGEGISSIAVALIDSITG